MSKSDREQVSDLVLSAATEQDALEAIESRRAARKCGPCSACCGDMVSYPVPSSADPSLKKPYEACSALCPSGCSRYESKPDECSAYMCAWRSGLLPDDLRPDLAGALAELTEASQEAFPDVVGKVEEMTGLHPLTVRIQILDTGKLASARRVSEFFVGMSRKASMPILVGVGVRGVHENVIAAYYKGGPLRREQ